MRLGRDLPKISACFGDANLMSRGRPCPTNGPGRAGGPPALPGEYVRIVDACRANVAVRADCLIAGMAVGADCIDDMDILRHGAMGVLFAGIRAPATLESFLCAFTPVQRGLDGEGQPAVAGRAGPPRRYSPMIAATRRRRGRRRHHPRRVAALAEAIGAAPGCVHRHHRRREGCWVLQRGGMPRRHSRRRGSRSPRR